MGKAAVTSMAWRRYEVLSLRHYLQAQSWGHNTTDCLEKRGMKRGNKSFLKWQDGAIIIGTVSKTTLGKRPRDGMECIELNSLSLILYCIIMFFWQNSLHRVYVTCMYTHHPHVNIQHTIRNEKLDEVTIFISLFTCQSLALKKGVSPQNTHIFCVVSLKSAFKKNMISL